jgi:condensin-2 complex subunit H2
MAENWDIDVAKELEDYLEELESVSITFDNGKTSLNFAEAALVIQVKGVKVHVGMVV